MHDRHKLKFGVQFWKNSLAVASGKYECHGRHGNVTTDSFQSVCACAFKFLYGITYTLWRYGTQLARLPSKLREIDLFVQFECYGPGGNVGYIICNKTSNFKLSCVRGSMRIENNFSSSFRGRAEGDGKVEGRQALRLHLADCHSEVQTHSLRTTIRLFISIPPKAKIRFYDFLLSESLRLPLKILSPPVHRLHPPSSKCVPSSQYENEVLQVISDWAIVCQWEKIYRCGNSRRIWWVDVMC